MKTLEEIYNCICRFCLRFENRGKMISLSDKSREDGLSCYAKAVSILTDIVSEKHDQLPPFMCINCLNSLRQSIYFKFRCENSDKCLKNIAKQYSENGNFKRAVVEFALFNFYLYDDKLFLSKNKYNEPISQLQSNLNGETDCDSFVEVKNDADSSLDERSIPENDKDSITNEDVILEKMEDVFGSTSCISLDVNTNIAKPRRKKIKHKRKVGRTEHLKNQEKLKCNSENYNCNICKKTLANQHTYEHHMQRHNGCRYICEHCGKGFPVLTELQIHQVSRHGTGPYLQCSHCTFKAPRKFDLIEHERIHTGERPYTCDKCGLTFRRRGIWKKHLIYHTEKRVQCTQCHRKFFHRSEMLAHANNVHDRVYMYLCSKCGATYAKTATVRRHMAERHGIPKEAQGKIIRIHKGSSCQEQ